MKRKNEIEARVNMLKTSRKNGVSTLDDKINFLELVADNNFSEDRVHQFLSDSVKDRNYQMCSVIIWLLE